MKSCGRDELLKNEESRALTVELDGTLCQVQERLSEEATIITSDRVLELGEANENHSVALVTVRRLTGRYRLPTIKS